MKKIFTLLTLLVLAMTVNAQETYRKSWDFTKWSTTTIANLKAEAAKVTINADQTGVTDGGGATWSDMEKTSSCGTYTASKDKCWWQVTHGVTTANGEEIAEFEGLTFTNESDRNLAIALDYPTTSLGTYHGPSYLWLGGAKKDYFIIPGIAPGTTIRMGVESHKPSEGRGVQLFIAKSKTETTHGTQLKAPDGTEVATPKVYADQEWLLPTDIPETDQKNANEDGTYNVVVYNTNGCHVYYITVGDGDAPQTEEAKKVAYLGTNDDFTLGLFDASVVDATVVDAVPSLEALHENYEALVIGTGATEAQLAALKNVIAFFPVVNTNPALYAALGLGSAAEAASSTLTIADASNTIFEGLDDAIETAGISALTLGDYFANDKILAKAGDATAMHVHNAGRNAYYFVPVDENTPALYQLLSNTIIAASKSKKAVAAVGTPSISTKQADGVTTVTITAANSQAIYYTTDGTNPTTASIKYAEPFDITAAATVKAFATGDGYTDSEVASADVKIASQAAAPVFALNRENGKTTVTLTTATEGVDIYYNFAGQSATTASVKYTEPFEVTSPANVTAFANGADGILPSAPVKKFIGVDGINASNIRWDVVAHFNANSENWSGKGQQTDDNGAIINANYFFTWGKNAGSYWDETSAEIIKASDGVTDSTIYTKSLAPSTYEADGWILTSIGQVMTWEKLNTGWNIGDTSMRNPDTAEDAIGVNDEEGITENALTFGKQPTGGPFNANLQTSSKIAAPFDVVVYAGNGNDGEIPTMQIEVSADGENWTKIGDVNYSLIKRNWKRTQLSYEGTDEVYVRLLHTKAKSGGQIYDIYVLNNGEKSKAYNEETVGISTVKPAIATKAAIYNLNGVRQQSLKRGLNIIIENGKARKVMVK